MLTIIIIMPCQYHPIECQGAGPRLFSKDHNKGLNAKNQDRVLEGQGQELHFGPLRSP